VSESVANNVAERAAPRAVAAIQLVRLRKTFGDVVAVDDVDLEIAEGEFFSLLGPSGSGKTTVLRMIAGFEAPTGGAVLLQGSDVTKTAPYDRDVNTVFQDYALFPHMSVQRNVEYGLKVKGVARAERRRRAGEALEAVRLGDFGGRRPHEMSGGQRQRVALARALVNRPKVLLLDEPLGALDLKLREEMQVELKAIQHDVGITFVFVTHDQGEALSMSSRIAVFNHGRIEQVGAPREIYDQPSTSFVANFVGTSNMLSVGLSARVLGAPIAHTLRPERIRLMSSTDFLPPDFVSVTGAIDDITYLGADSRVRARTADGDVLIASVASDALTGLHAGSEVHLAWAPRCRQAARRRHRCRHDRHRPVHQARGDTMRSTRTKAVATALALSTTFGLIAAACGSSSSSSGAKAQTSIGKGEGALSIIAWAGYAEDGTNDPTQNWVKPFEDQTGCKVSVKIGNTSDEMFSLMQSGAYDGVSASGDASVRLIDANLVAPVNTSLFANYADISPFLKDTNYNSSGGKNYGIPHGWGANYLMYNTDVVSPAPDSWGAVFDKASPYKGKVTAYDAPIYIADAALYLATAQPDLGIKDPYSLTQKQFDAAVALLKDQHSIIGEYWSNYALSQQAFEQGNIVLGTTWQIIASLAQLDKAKVATVLPKEGSTGWSDTWMIAAKAKHPNCMYMWMNYITTPDVQAQVAQWFGEAPANQKACDVIDKTDNTFCDTYKAKDSAFASAIHFWATPRKKCLDGSGDNCVPFADWIKAWTEIKG